MSTFSISPGSLILFAFCWFLLSGSTSALAVVRSNDPLESNPLVQESSDPDLLRRLRALSQDVQINGCSVNLCFALQGDDFITDLEFNGQRNFVRLVVSILTTNRPGRLSAVQYGETTFPISPLTSNRLTFLDRLEEATQVGGLESDISGALAYCGSQVRAQEGDANKIVLFGNGFETVGAVPNFIAESVRQDGTGICAVAVGQFSFSELVGITGDPNRVFRVSKFLDLGDVIEGLVRGVCNLPSSNN